MKWRIDEERERVCVGGVGGWYTARSRAAAAAAALDLVIGSGLYQVGTIGELAFAF